MHHSVTKALRIAGIGRDRIRRITVDDAFRLPVDQLRTLVRADRAAGLTPFFVCGSAGTVNTGSVDALGEIAAVAREEGLWFHVDAAYGGCFRMLPELAATLAGIEGADSIAVAPHKGLFLAYGTGALLVKDLDDLRRAFSEEAEYLPNLRDEADGLDFAPLSPELSRDWRGLRLWLPFKLHGIEQFRAALAEKRRLALDLYDGLHKRADVEIPARPELSLFAFRRRWPNATLEEENRGNELLLTRINQPRRVFLTSTRIEGRVFIRLCILHLRTDKKRVREAASIITEALDSLPAHP